MGDVIGVTVDVIGVGVDVIGAVGDVIDAVGDVIGAVGDDTVIREADEGNRWTMLPIARLDVSTKRGENSFTAVVTG